MIQFDSTDNIQIKSYPQASEHHVNFQDWCVAEWEKIDPFFVDRFGTTLPDPIYATHDGRLVGGLVFTRAIPNHASDYELWINAIIVAPSHRRQGIASGLIRAAQTMIAASTDTRLYALTDVPELYAKLGWETIETGKDGSVMCLC